jgi:hypothetical protein
MEFAKIDIYFVYLKKIDKSKCECMPIPGIPLEYLISKPKV